MAHPDDLRHGRPCCCFTKGNKHRRCIEAALDLGHCGDADAEPDACLCAHPDGKKAV